MTLSGVFYTPDGKRLAGEPGPAGECPAQGDGEAAPQLGSAGVEQDGAGVVVAIRAQRLTDPGVVPVVPVRAGELVAVRAGLAASAGTASLRLAAFVARI